MSDSETSSDPDDVLTGEKLARLAAADFESFFHPDGEVSVRIFVEPVHSARIRGTGPNSRIIITPDMARDVIDGPDRLHLHLLILGHEIAHLVHRHVQDKPPETSEIRALEYWADFYGAKVMMTLVTCGGNISPIYRKYFPIDRFDPALRSMGSAVGTMVEAVYNINKYYPDPLVRVSLTTNGIICVLRRIMLAADVDILWMFSAASRIMLAPPTRRLINTHPDQLDRFLTPLEDARQWHLNMQKSHPPIDRWLHPYLLPFLSTTFEESELAIELAKAERREELDRLAQALDEPDLFKDR
ncbi:hypothetical protein ACQZ48_22445 [Agrobacterium sp. 22-209-1]